MEGATIFEFELHLDRDNTAVILILLSTTTMKGTKKGTMKGTMAMRQQSTSG
jgi:hypothetical protein